MAANGARAKALDTSIIRKQTGELIAAAQGKVAMWLAPLVVDISIMADELDRLTAIEAAAKALMHYIDTNPYGAGELKATDELRAALAPQEE